MPRLGLFVFNSCAAGFLCSLAYEDPTKSSGKSVGILVGAMLTGILLLGANGAGTWLVDYMSGT
ncbi:hypothetical protein PXH69_29275 [Rhodococcus qingshengii]|uniref:Uncharacterized protein n=1 Tax=Rhodococcus qingshengii TaxID=334542 RepID=A0AAW6LV08_RHOSG|nr:hypothetical protein [Rhodococcus qingshengii]MDE8649071.1 hypothetical protein [Rhodococcus qingshengii]